MLKFGAVTIDVSHPKTFAKVLAQGERAQYTAVFNDGFRTEEEVKAFADEYGLKIYDDLDAMIDDIDIGLIHSCNWDKHMDYVKHFIRKGKPVFVDKPLVGNLKDCEELLRLTKEGARILGTSAMRFCPEVEDAKKTMKEAGSQPVHITTTVGVDEYNYAIHAMELICSLMQCRPVSCRYIGKANASGVGESCESYYVTFENGAAATYHAVSKKFVYSNTIVLTNSGLDIVFTPALPTLYVNLMNRICESVETGENALASMEDMVDALKVFFAGKVSKNEGGTEISLDSPKLYDVSFDGYAFEEAYAASQKKK